MASDDSSDDHELFERVNWPDDLPGNDDFYFSISCGNTSVFWGWGVFNDSSSHLKFAWRCNSKWNLADEEFLAKEPIEQLDLLLAQEVKEQLFDGKLNRGTVEQRAASVRHPVIYAYLVATDMGKARLLTRMLRAVNMRVFLLRNSDILMGKSAYQGIGVDRIVGIRAAQTVTGFPALVLDGGTAFTYTATDHNGNILGGGISPGLKSKLQAMHEHTAALPELTRNNLVKLSSKGKRYDMFGRTTEDNMYGAVLFEIQAYCCRIIEEWSDRSRQLLATLKNGEHNGSVKLNTDLKILVTGGDRDVIESLIVDDGTFLRRIGNKQNNRIKNKLVTIPHAHHSAIHDVLRDHYKQIKQGAMENIRQELVGQRVALSTDKMGTIAGVRRGNKLSLDSYHIYFDDLERSKVSTEEVVAGLKKFQSVGDSSLKKTQGMFALQNLQDILQAEKASTKPPPTSTGTAGPVSPPQVTNVEREDIEEKPAPATPPATKPVATSETTLKSPPPPDGLAAIHKELKRPSMPLEKAAKKAKTVTPDYIREHPLEFLEKRMAKYFDDDLYFGKVKSFFDVNDTDSDEEELWNIEYDDGDLEDMDAGTLWQALELYHAHASEDPKSS